MKQSHRAVDCFATPFIATTQKSISPHVTGQVGCTILQPGKVRYRAGDHELMPNIFVGEVHQRKSGADDVFTVNVLVPGEEAAGSVADTGCKMVQPT